MCPSNSRLKIFGVSVCVLGVAVGVATQAPPGRPIGDGLLRSELSLGGRTTILAYPPDLKANDPAHARLLSATPGPAPRVRVGQLDTTGGVRLGPLELGRSDPSAGANASPGGDQPAAAGVRTPGPVATHYDLWLEGSGSGWQLQVTDATHAAVGQVALARQAASPAAPTFAAALIPEDATLGRLTLLWGAYQATVDVQYITPSRRRLAENGAPNETVKRTHDEDTSVLSRARLLAQRNETAVVLPAGQRLSISFERTLAKGERGQGNLNRRGLGVDGPDFARLTTTPDGAIVLLTESSVPRLRTEAALRFGQTLVKTGNQVVGFPGSYGVWLKRAGTDWRLVFNHEPDAWGSQHDPKFDAAEIPLQHTDGHLAVRPFAVALIPVAADRGRLVIIWGSHEWTADFAAIG